MNILKFICIFILIIFLESCILGDLNKYLRRFIIGITMAILSMINIIFRINEYTSSTFILLIILEVIYIISISIIFVYIHGNGEN